MSVHMKEKGTNKLIQRGPSDHGVTSPPSPPLAALSTWTRVALRELGTTWRRDQFEHAPKLKHTSHLSKWNTVAVVKYAEFFIY